MLSFTEFYISRVWSFPPHLGATTKKIKKAVKEKAPPEKIRVTPAVEGGRHLA